MRLAAALPRQFHLPSRPGDPAYGKLPGSDATDAPSGGGCRGHRQGIVPAASPPPDHQGHGRMILGGELKPPSGGHGDAADLPDDRRQPAAAKSFFHDGKRIFFPPALRIDQAAGHKAGLLQCRREQVVPGHHPQDGARAWSARGDSGGEQGGRRIIVKGRAASGHFMKCPGRQPAASEPLVEGANSKRQGLASLASRRGFDCPHLGAQGIEAGGRGRG